MLLRVLFIDDNEDHARSTVTLLKHIAAKKFDFPVDFRSHRLRKMEGDLVERLVDSYDPHMVFLDYSFGRESSEAYPNGLILGERITKKRPSCVISLVSGRGREEIGNVLIRDLKNGGIVKDFITKGALDEFDQIASSINRNKFAPVDVGITGGGNLAVALQHNLYHSSSVNHTHVYSRFLAERASDEDFGLLYDPSRSTLTKSLDQLLDLEPHILFLTSSGAGSWALKNKVIPEKGDYARLGLFPYEIKLYKDDAQKIVRSGYTGLIVPLVNPVGGIIKILMDAGIPPDRITYPYNNDISRAVDSLNVRPQRLISDEFVERLIKGANEEGFVMGLHGMPTIAIPDDVYESRFSEALSGRSIRAWKRSVRRGLVNTVKESWNRGTQETMLQEKIRLPYIDMVAKGIVQLVEDIARFRQFRHNAYSFDKRHQTSWASPSIVRYLLDGVHVSQNEELVMGRFKGGEVCYYPKSSLPEILAEHKGYYNGVLDSCQ